MYVCVCVLCADVETDSVDCARVQFYSVKQNKMKKFYINEVDFVKRYSAYKEKTAGFHHMTGRVLWQKRWRVCDGKVQWEDHGQVVGK